MRNGTNETRLVALLQKYVSWGMPSLVPEITGSQSHGVHPSFPATPASTLLMLHPPRNSHGVGMEGYLG